MAVPLERQILLGDVAPLARAALGLENAVLSTAAASAAEVMEGTDEAKFITPKALKNAAPYVSADDIIDGGTF